MVSTVASQQERPVSKSPSAVRMFSPSSHGLTICSWYFPAFSPVNAGSAPCHLWTSISGCREWMNEQLISLHTTWLTSASSEYSLEMNDLLFTILKRPSLHPFLSFGWLWSAQFSWVINLHQESLSTCFIGNAAYLMGIIWKLKGCIALSGQDRNKWTENKHHYLEEENKRLKGC